MINLINLCAPNSDYPHFFSEIDKLTTYEDADYVVMCHDFYLVLNPSKYSQNYTNINSPKSRSKLITSLNERDLADIYRVHNVEEMRFTWRRKNPIKQGLIIS